MVDLGGGRVHSVSLVRVPQHGADVDDGLLAFGREEVGLPLHLAVILRVSEQVDAVRVDLAHAPVEEDAQPAVVRRGRELLVEDRDRLLERVVVRKELLRARRRLSSRETHRDTQRDKETQRDTHAHT